MIRLPSLLLPAEARQILRRYQREVDDKPTYADRVEAADRLFKSRNTLPNRTFRVVRLKLHEMCSGARRCCYCEDSCADEVEHVRPKSLYPEQVFVWENYLYSCGPCNGPKNNQYAVFARKGNKLVPVTRGKNDPSNLRQPVRTCSSTHETKTQLDFMEARSAGDVSLRADGRGGNGGLSPSQVHDRGPFA